MYFLRSFNYRMIFVYSANNKNLNLNLYVTFISRLIAYTAVPSFHKE